MFMSKALVIFGGVSLGILPGFLPGFFQEFLTRNSEGYHILRETPRQKSKKVLEIIEKKNSPKELCFEQSLTRNCRRNSTKNFWKIPEETSRGGTLHSYKEVFRV